MIPSVNELVRGDGVLPSPGRAALLAVFVAVLCASPLHAAEDSVYFSENFNSGQQNPHLFGYENFTLADGVIRSNGLIANHDDRRYIRTTTSDYNTRDFIYELTFTTTLVDQVSINYMGIGRGNKRTDQPNFGYNEPWESLTFRVHTPNVQDGYISIADSPVNDLVILGDIPNGGTHRARIKKVGKEITFSIDRNYNGIFSADMSHTFPDIEVVAPYLDPLNSRLFFGTALPVDSFDDLLIAPIPEPAGVVLCVMGMAALACLRRNRAAK